MGLFRNKWSRWKPVHIYTHGWCQYLIQAKVNKETGRIKFRTDKINNWKHQHTQMTCLKNPFNFEEAIKELL